MVGSLDGLCHRDDGSGGAFIELWLMLWSCWVRAFIVALTLLGDLVFFIGDGFVDGRFGLKGGVTLAEVISWGYLIRG